MYKLKERFKKYSPTPQLSFTREVSGNIGSTPGRKSRKRYSSSRFVSFYDRTKQHLAINGSAISQPQRMCLVHLVSTQGVAAFKDNNGTLYLK